jgi:drug/metabolite transporter (DMT)-like permease
MKLTLFILGYISGLVGLFMLLGTVMPDATTNNNPVMGVIMAVITLALIGVGIFFVYKALQDNPGMKIPLLIFGYITGLGGLMVFSGVILQLGEGSSDNTTMNDIFGLIILGVIPLAVGSFFIYKALKK